jgi:beta-glucanase (GH16 family)
MSTPIDLTQDFHVYAVEWSQNDVKFFFDGVQYGETTPNDLPSGSTWLGNNPYFVIVSTGVEENASGACPTDMLVDYVRVYQRAGHGVHRLPKHYRN